MSHVQSACCCLEALATVSSALYSVFVERNPSLGKRRFLNKLDCNRADIVDFWWMYYPHLREDLASIAPWRGAGYNAFAAFPRMLLAGPRWLLAVYYLVSVTFCSGGMVATLLAVFVRRLSKGQTLIDHFQGVHPVGSPDNVFTTLRKHLGSGSIQWSLPQNCLGFGRLLKPYRAAKKPL